MNKEAALIEAILFLEPDGISFDKIVKVSKLNDEIVRKALELLQTKYSAENSGLELLFIGNIYSLTPKTDLIDLLKEHYGKKIDDKMSKAALETLAIIAYSQPVTKAEIESIRGVSCQAVVKYLQEKELIYEMGRKDTPGRPVQLGTTKTFLQTFGIESIADLPKLDEDQRGRFELKES